MPIEMVSGISQGMGVLDGGGDHRRRRGSLCVNLGHSIVTNGHFVMQIFPNYFGPNLFML